MKIRDENYQMETLVTLWDWICYPVGIVLVVDLMLNLSSVGYCKLLIWFWIYSSNTLASNID